MYSPLTLVLFSFFVSASFFLPNQSLLADPAQPRTNAQIQASGQHYSGNLMLNQAVGNRMQQANVRAISAGELSRSAVHVQQAISSIAPDSVGLNTAAKIEGASFSQGHGALGVNQSAGIANQSINIFRMTLSAMPKDMDDSVLSQNAAPTMNSDAVVPQQGERRVEIDDRAFSGSSGVVQLNQSAGVGNRTANNLNISVMQ
ncbi:MAG: adhesin [Pseudomonas sp.]